MTERSAIQPARLIEKYYRDNPTTWKILLDHSRCVTRRSLLIGRRLAALGHRIDLQFIGEAAMLHDIGILYTATPDLNCSGEHPYLMHGVKGAELVDKEGWPRHARVCERHIGIGLTAAEIKKNKLPLPARDMLPETLEEQIICYADLFYSKGSKNRGKEKTADQVRRKLAQFGTDKIAVFNHWHDLFEPEA